MHREIARRLLADPGVLEAARRRVDEWLERGSVHRDYAEAWARLLAEPPAQLAEKLTDPGEYYRALRQCSPFAGALGARERWAIRRQVREQTR